MQSAKPEMCCLCMQMSRLRLSCVSYAGPDGLWAGSTSLTLDFANIVLRIKALGFNAVRLPFSFKVPCSPNIFELPVANLCSVQSCEVQYPVIHWPAVTCDHPQCTYASTTAACCSACASLTCTIFSWQQQHDAALNAQTQNGVLPCSLQDLNKPMQSFARSCQFVSGSQLASSTVPPGTNVASGASFPSLSSPPQRTQTLGRLLLLSGMVPSFGFQRCDQHLCILCSVVCVGTAIELCKHVSRFC